MAQKVFVFGLNPSAGTILTFDRLQLGSVNRARKCTKDIGGKGQNCAKALLSSGVSPHSFEVIQVLGGTTGKDVERLEKDRYGIRSHTIWVDVPTRQTTTVVDAAGTITELIEPAPPLSAHDAAHLDTLIQNLLNASNSDIAGVALCGSLPAGSPLGLYTTIAKNLKRNHPNAVLFVDSVADKECLRSEAVTILKINRSEAIGLLGIDDSNSLGVSGDADIALQLLREFPIRIVAITNGPDRATLAEMTEPIQVTTFVIPSLAGLVESNPGIRSAAKMQDGKLLVNPIGAGDTCTAVFFSTFLMTKDSRSAFKAGLAAASASCLVLDELGRFDLAIANQIGNGIEFEFITRS
ncbi:Ribokinase-like protein [Cladochytrium replicatum]|nr:Ribokinase-like protein [Cladochytrium replicatum]